MEQSLVKECIGVGVTALRFGLAVHMANRIRDGAPIDTAMSVFMAADVLDGVVLRRLGIDSPVRRVADTAVDHLSFAKIGVEMARQNPATCPYLGVIAARTVVTGGLGAYHYLRTGEVTKGGIAEKALSAATALFTVTAASGNCPLTKLTGMLAAGVALATVPRAIHGVGRRNGGRIRQL